MRLFVKSIDILIILLAAGIAFFSAYSVYLTPQNNAQILIRGQGSEWIFAMGARETVTVKGALGDTVVRIEENRAWVEKSPCLNQTCVAAGLITKQGQWAACLPNNVLLIIQSGEKSDVDIVVW